MINSINSKRTLPFGLFGLVLSLLASTMSAPEPARAQQSPGCESGIGGRIFSNGGEVEVEILPASAGYTSELHFVSPGPERLIGTNRDGGTIARLGAFPSGTELIFDIVVRETTDTFMIGPASRNPDGVGHADVTCFGEGTAKIGFEDVMGGGDRNYADLIFAVRQPITACNYSLSIASQSFDAGGGSGSFSVGTSGGCSWAAAANAGWIAITSGASGSNNGTVSYSVAINANSGSRTGTITVQGRTFTVFEDGAGSLPLITSAIRNGKQMLVNGINFDSGSVILLNGEEQKTLHDDSNPRTILIGKRVGKFALAGDKLQVRSSSGGLSPQFTYTP
jgi:hypothetical protein